MSINVEDGVRVNNDLHVPGEFGLKDLSGGKFSVSPANIVRVAEWAKTNGLEVKVGDTGGDGWLTLSFGAKYAAPSISSAAARAAQCSF